MAVNKATKKRLWNDSESLFLLKNSKKMNLPDLVLSLNENISTIARDESSVMKQCTVIGCGYTNQIK